jgi:hypothetical protein
MNPNNYGTFEACQKLKDAGIVLETDCVWAEAPEWEILNCVTIAGKIKYKDSIPAPSMAEVWRELPDTYRGNFGDDFGYEKALQKEGDLTRASYTDFTWYENAQGFGNTNPTDALIYLLIWVTQQRKEGA